MVRARNSAPCGPRPSSCSHSTVISAAAAIAAASHVPALLRVQRAPDGAAVRAGEQCGEQLCDLRLGRLGAQLVGHAKAPARALLQLLATLLQALVLVVEGVHEAAEAV